MEMSVRKRFLLLNIDDTGFRSPSLRNLFVIEIIGTVRSNKKGAANAPQPRNFSFFYQYLTATVKLCIGPFHEQFGSNLGEKYLSAWSLLGAPNRPLISITKRQHLMILLTIVCAKGLYGFPYTPYWPFTKFKGTQ
jgi:hypothetical protein